MAVRRVKLSRQKWEACYRARWANWLAVRTNADSLGTPIFPKMLRRRLQIVWTVTLLTAAISLRFLPEMSISIRNKRFADSGLAGYAPAGWQSAATFGPEHRRADVVEEIGIGPG